MNVDRLFARGFVIAGGLFWMIASFAALYAYVGSSASAALLAAFFPFAATAAALAIGWYFERTVSALLVLGSVAVVVWGAVASWEIGVWILMAVFMIGPMLTAAALFTMARREQEQFELALAERAQLAPVPAGASRS
jgi:intracellular septation protein A